MNPQSCKHCNKLFVPGPNGMGSMLCRGCAVDCDLSYNKIHKFIKANQFVSAEQVAEGADVPAVFVLALIRDGRFGDSADVRMQSVCIRCGHDLKKNEVSICNACKVLITHKMREPNKPVAYQAPPAPSKKPGKKSGDDKKYGLGR